jgi:malate dehydrogenase (oxaloacetate-decarboxylating)(NADP+)
MSKENNLHEKALAYHKFPNPGKISTYLPKQLNNLQDLSLAYSPGVAAPCLEIAKDPSKAYEYTNKCNTVAIISNGTAVLGLGNIGALASKPVMEGKAALLKKFAYIDSFDILVKTQDVNEFITTVSNIGLTFGAINLEDIKAPDCFIIEKKLEEMLDIPVFHDDQHGTAITLSAALLNALEIQGKNIKNVNIIFNGAGAASIASAHLLLEFGVQTDQITMFDSKGMLVESRSDINEWKKKFAKNTKALSLKEAMQGADIFIGLSSAGILSGDMVSSMANNPIIFAMANPVPEVLPDVVYAARRDAIIATGRSDYPNQVNNLVAFPYIFRGLLDAKAQKVTNSMKVNVAKAIANIAKQPVLDTVKNIHMRDNMVFGPQYIIPSPFDTRLLENIPKVIIDEVLSKS